jgi:hypothetical protein
MKYDIQPYKSDKRCKGFYVWNKPTFFVNKKDERYNSMLVEKKETGMSRDETWDLKTNIAVFLVPRLKLFKEEQQNIGGHPGCFENKEEWYKILDKIIFSFEAQLKDEFDVPKKYLKKYHKKDFERESKARDDYWNDINEGIKLFAEYFCCLWW